MAKLRVRSKKKGGSGGSGIVRLKFVVEKLQKSLLMVRNNNKKYDDEGSCVPEDVKEGHFAVIADEGSDDREELPKRFVMPLSCLHNPTFLRLLEQAAEEYGFDHEGALTIPCRPSVLQRILMMEQQWHHHEEDGASSDKSRNSSSSNDESMVLRTY